MNRDLEDLKTHLEYAIRCERIHREISENWKRTIETTKEKIKEIEDGR